MITDGVPCTIIYGGTDGNFVEQMRQNSDWEMGDPPLPLLPRLPNQSAHDSSSYFVYPMHSTTAGAQRGLFFDLSNGLPRFNTAFGSRILTHKVFGTNVTAPIAIFFSAMGTDHPAGGPLSADGSAVPNYVYYYSQAYPSPFGIEVRFWNQVSSNAQDPDFIKIGTGAHGLSGSGPGGGIGASGGNDTDLFAKLPTTGELVWAGQQKIRGLDKYARNVYHESVHHRLSDAVQDGAADTDEDGLPDSIESQIGTDPEDPDSTDFGTNADGSPNIYSDLADEEVFCRMCERDLDVPENDWADDGFNWGRPAPPNVCYRVVEVFWHNYTKEGLQWPDARALMP